jgi:type 1 glutamine amidotransferase
MNPPTEFMNASSFRPLLLLFMAAFVPAFSPVAQDYKVLVFSKTAAFRHDSITNGWAMIQQLGSSNGFAVDITEDATAFSYTNLSKYAAVVWLSTTGDVLDDNQQAEFQQYIHHSGGYVGIHSATDTEYTWPWYGQLVGSYFSNHPAIVTATVKVADPVHPSTATLPRRWSRTDEWYNFQSNPRGAVHVLATLDETTYSPGGAPGTQPLVTLLQVIPSPSSDAMSSAVSNGQPAQKAGMPAQPLIPTIAKSFSTRLRQIQ